MRAHLLRYRSGIDRRDRARLAGTPVTERIRVSGSAVFGSDLGVLSIRVHSGGSRTCAVNRLRKLSAFRVTEPRAAPRGPPRALEHRMERESPNREETRGGKRESLSAV